MKIESASIENERELDSLLWSQTETGVTARESLKKGEYTDSKFIVPIVYPFVFHQAHI